MRSFNLWLYGLHQARLLRQGRGQHLTTLRYLKNRTRFTKPQSVWLNISKTVRRRTSASLTLFVIVWMSNRNELQVTSHQEAVKTIMLGGWMVDVYTRIRLTRLASLSLTNISNAAILKWKKGGSEYVYCPTDTSIWYDNRGERHMRWGVSCEMSSYIDLGMAGAGCVPEEGSAITTETW